MKFLFLFILLCLTTLSFAQTCTGSVGDPIVNETFGAGNPNPGPPLGPGKTTRLSYDNSICPNDGYYSIINYTSGCWGSDVTWHTATDHTGNAGGYFMLINASYQPSDFYVQKITGLCEGTTFQFAAWMLNMCGVSGILPNITMTIEKINGTILAKYETGNIPIINPLTWKQYGFNFTTPAGVSEVVLRMRNNAPGGIGNDVGLDDITFRPIGPDIKVTAAGVSGDTAVLCEGNANSIRFESLVDSCYLNTAYQWQQSLNGGDWTDIAGAVSASFTATPAIPGEYRYRMAAAPAANIGNLLCRVTSLPFTAMVHAKNNSAIQIAQSPAQVCAGDPATFTATIANGGSTPHYQWQVNGEKVGTDSAAFASTTLNNGDVVSCIFTSSLPCNAPVTSNAIAIKVGKPVSVALTETICEGESYAGYSQTGVYTDVFKSSSGCDSTRVINLTVKNKTALTIDTTICFGSNFNGYTTTGVYSATFMGANGCDSVVTTRLTVLPDINRKVWNDTLLCTGDTIVLTPGIFDTYRWQDGSVHSSLTVRQGGTYSAMVGNRCGSALKSIHVDERVCTVTFPTGFTPNADGRNDVFKALNAYNLPYFRMRVVNRWGQRLFASGNPATGWDGMLQGKPAENGTYIWMCEYQKPGSAAITYIKGVVTLLR